MQSFKELIYHTKSEKRSLLLLVCIIVSMTYLKRYLVTRYTPSVSDITYLESFLEPVKVFETIKNSRPEISKEELKHDNTLNEQELVSNQDKMVESYTIDPNTASADSLRLLGLSTFAVSNLIKYREKGGQIKSPQQLKKIYGIDSGTYQRVKNQIEIKLEKVTPQKQDNKGPNPNITDRSKQTRNDPKPKKQHVLININNADEVQLQYIRGIGPSFAKRIVKYRELIGGYHSKDQLKEVYGIDHKKYQEIRDQIEVNGNIRKININNMDHKALSNHPYISYQEAKLLVAYGKKHGPFTNAYDIVKIGVMDSLFVEKIIPYLPDSMIHHKAQVPPTSL